MIPGHSFQALDAPFGPLPAGVGLTVRVPIGPEGTDSAPSAVPESAIAELCKTKPEFELLGQLGEGAFGRVYLARQHALGGRLVALKVSGEDIGEAQILARLLHANIVPVYSTHKLGYCSAVCMPYLGSTTLADLIQEFRQSGLPESGRHLVSTLQSQRNTVRKTDRPTSPGPTPPEQEGIAWPAEPIPVLAPSTRALLDSFAEMSYAESVVWIAQQLADGLAHAHERGIIHRDLKPANVLLTDDGTPMLLDFNLAADARSAESARLGGTLPYMAPEVLRRVLGEPGATADPGPESDLYSLGLILFELLTGLRLAPPSGPTHEYTRRLLAARSGPAPLLRDLNPAVSPALESIVRHCLEPDPARRYRTARELEEDLKRQRENRPLRYARDPSLPERARKWARRHPRLASLLCAGVAGVVVTAGLCASLAGYRGWALRLESERALERFADRAALVHFASGQSLEDADASAQKAREALEPFRVLGDPRWRERPPARHLPEGKREQLEATVGALLLVLARSEAARASAIPPGEERDDRVRAAVEFNVRAEHEGAGRHLPRAVLAQKADLLRLQGAEQEARLARAKAENEKPRGAADASMTGRELLALGEYAQALGFLRDATRQAPDDAAAWFLLACCQDGLGEHRDAIASYTVALALRPRTATAHFQRGVAYMRVNDNAQALEDFTAAIELGHATVDAHINRGLTLHRLGRLKEAIKEIDRAVELNAPYTRVYFIRARLRDQAGDRDGARRDREEGLRRDPTDEHSWVARGVARLEDDPRGALADFLAAVKLNPRSLAGMVNAAHVLSERLGRTKEALALLDRAVGAYPDHARTRACRGLLRARLEKRAEALEDVKAVLRGTPEPAVLFQAGATYAQTSRDEVKDRPEAIRLLKLSLRRGYGHEQIAHSPDLAPLRQTAEFRRLAAAAQGLN